MSNGPAAAPRGFLSPEGLYLILSGGYAFFFALVITVNLIFQTQEAGLGPFRLVIIGTVLEATRFICEVPTGVVADAISRRLSILLGLALVAAGLVLGGAFAMFETILVAQVIWGIGSTFISGAKEAWIADEIGVTRISRVYLRAAQVELIARLVAIPASIALATLELRLPILLGGALLLPLALFLALTMTERGFKPASGGGQARSQAMSEALQSFRSTLLAGGRLVRVSPLLLTVFVIAACYGAASEGFERLWVAHFFTNMGFPATWDLQPVVWLGAVRMGSAVLGIIAVEAVRRYLDTTDHRTVVRGLFGMYALQLLSLAVFAASGNFWLGMLMFWGVVGLSRTFKPLYLAWLNQKIDSSVRATVLSMNSQVDALGQIAGGPPLGALGSLVSLRAALFGSAWVMALGLPLFLRAFRQGTPAVEPKPAAAGT
jgi:DHA3 family tetracycline resistance protein-like MFS transporter